MRKKKTEAATTTEAPVKAKPRTVKINDELHHKIRVLSVKQRIPLQSFIENMLLVGLREKVYEKFDGALEKASA